MPILPELFNGGSVLYVQKGLNKSLLTYCPIAQPVFASLVSIPLQQRSRCEDTNGSKWQLILSGGKPSMEVKGFIPHLHVYFI